MRNFICTLYLPLILIANAASAREADKLDVYSTPRAPINAQIENTDGDVLQFGEDDAKLRVVNLWALWCVSCRKELPTLAELSEKYQSQGLEVITIAVGRNDKDKVDEFLREIGSENLPVYYDKKQKYFAQAGGVGLPHTVFLSPDGSEIGRIIGEADFLDEKLQRKILGLLARE